MDHQQSIETGAAESYLLGELPPETREEFEQHFFECPECAEDVRIGFQFSQNVKAVFHEQARTKRAGWLSRIRPIAQMPLAACLAIAAFSGYQNAVQIPALRARTETPLVLSPSVVLAPSLRGDAPPLVIPQGADFLPVSLAPGAARGGGKYECLLKSSSGETLWKVPVSTLDPDANLTILIPTAKLSTGRYEAILAGIAGGHPTELDRYRFSIRRE